MVHKDRGPTLPSSQAPWWVMADYPYEPLIGPLLVNGAQHSINLASSANRVDPTLTDGGPLILKAGWA